MGIVPNQEGEFSGFYFAHCLDERIEIEVRKRLGFLSEYEAWKPIFPPEFVAPGAERIVQPVLSMVNCWTFYIRFVGTPGEPDICGYQGCCCRRVTVHQVLELKAVESGIG